MTRPTMWSVFGMDAHKEINGVAIEYFGSFRVTLARAGGQNAAFAKAYEVRMRPHRQAAKVPGALSEKMQQSIIRAVYLDSVIKKFESNVETDEAKPAIWEPIIVMEDGTQMEPTRPNLEMLLELLPDLLNQIIQDSNDLVLYRKEQLESEAGN